MRYFLHLSYKGTNYHGWQRQAKVISVQEVIEDTLNKILKTNTYIVGCGRTDKGVHASQFYAHFDTSIEWDFDLAYRLNKSLPSDIAIIEVIKMAGVPSARFDAISRTYEYYLHHFKSPFTDDLSTYWEAEQVDIAAMREAVNLLPQYDEYRAFCLNPDKHNTTICKVKKTSLSQNEKGQLVFTITANRFIKAMIRKLVYCLQRIGEGKMSIKTFEACLKTGKSETVIHSAYPQGLFLAEVTYPFFD